MTVHAPPSVTLIPWTQPYATVGSWTRTQSSSHLGGGNLTSPTTIDNSVSYRVALGVGTYTITAIGSKNATYGISTVALDGTSVGTLDWYAASGSANNVQTITGIGITVPGVYTLSFTAATKNASSTQYAQILTLLALHRTDDASGTIVGATLPHRVDIITWAGTSYAASTTATNVQTSAALSGGLSHTGSSVNNYREWLVPLAAGTHSFTMIHNANTDCPIYTVTLNGTSLGTFDGYAGVSAHNTVNAITGITVAQDGIYKLRLTAATKHASSSAYLMRPYHMILQRTGA